MNGSTERSLVLARRSFLVLSVAAVFSVLLAVLVNWLTVARYSPLPAPDLASSTAPAAVPSAEGAPPALGLLPPEIVGYETIARHEVPGRGPSMAEAVYKPNDMSQEAQVPIVAYARAERTGSKAAARARLAELMTPYAAAAARIGLNKVTIAASGFSAEHNDYVVAWVTGDAVVMVKASFQDYPPVQKKHFLDLTGKIVAEGVDKYLRTGSAGAFGHGGS